MNQDEQRQAILEAMFEQLHSNGQMVGILSTKKDEKGEYFPITFNKGTHMQALLEAVAGVKLATTEPLHSKAQQFIYDHDEKVVNGYYRDTSTPKTIHQPVVYQLIDGVDLLLNKTATANECTIKIYNSFINRQDFNQQYAEHEKRVHPLGSSPLGVNVIPCNATVVSRVAPQPGAGTGKGT